MARSRVHVWVLLVLALGAAGCAGGRISAAAEARGTVQTFLAQCAAGRGARVLETLNRPARHVFLDGGCAAVLRVPATAVAGLADVTPRLTRFDGAQATFALPRGAAGGVTLAVSWGSEGWRIEGPS